MYFSYITGCPWCSSRPANSFDQPNHVKSDWRQNIPEQFNIQRKYPEMISWYPEMISRDHNIQRWYSKLIFQRGIQRPEIILPLMSCASLPKYGPSFVPWSQVYSDEFLSGPDMIISCWRSWICKNVPPLTCRCLFYLCRLRQELFMVLCGVDWWSTQHPFFLPLSYSSVTSCDCHNTHSWSLVIVTMQFTATHQNHQTK